MAIRRDFQYGETNIDIPEGIISKRPVLISAKQRGTNN
jgi:hypothetical protein